MKTDITWDSVPWPRYISKLEKDASLPCEEEGTRPGWVVSHDGALVGVVTRDGTVNAEISGRLRHRADLDGALLPAVGDFVALRGASPAQVDRVLPRRTTFSRHEAGIRTQAQVICANADVALLVTTAPAIGEDGPRDLNDFSLRRLERYVATLDPRIRPVVVLNKCDLVEDPQAVRAYVAAELPGAIVVALSALTGGGVDTLAQILGPDDTAVAVGSSGCGKSTLIARLTGSDIETRAIRAADGRGRHTTTTRRIYRLPAGGLLVDTPGMREVQLWADEETGDDSVLAAFPEIAELEGTCHYRDCRHEHEPGCAIKEAIAAGEILPERYQSYLRLRSETETTAEMHRQRSRERGKQIAKFVRQLKKERSR